MTNFIFAVAFITRLIWNIFVIAGTFYAVQFYNWNPWWFLLSVCLLNLGIKTPDDKDTDDSSNCGC